MYLCVCVCIFVIIDQSVSFHLIRSLDILSCFQHLKTAPSWTLVFSNQHQFVSSYCCNQSAAPCTIVLQFRVTIGSLRLILSYGIYILNVCIHAALYCILLTCLCCPLRARMSSIRLWEYKSSVVTDSVVLLWCKKGSCLAEGEAIMAPLWIMRQECDPYLKVNVGSCPCRSPSQHCSLLHYRRWPWQHLIANNIHLNKSFHPVMILTNLISLKTSEKS